MKKFKLKAMGPKQILAYIGFLIAVVWTLKFIFELTSSGVKQVTSSESKQVTSSKKYPILKCTIIQNDNPVGSKVYDLNDFDSFFSVDVSKGYIEWDSKRRDDKGEIIRVSHSANRNTGSYSVGMIFPNGQIQSFFGKCEAGSLEKKF